MRVRADMTPVRPASDASALAPLTIDVTRLAARLLEGKHPTGVDRVSLAYLQHYRGRARALVRHWGRWVGLGTSGSRRLFSALMGEVPRPERTVRGAVAAGFLRSEGIAPGSLLFNTGHSGLDDPRYARQVRRRGLRPIYFLHDLIPLTHPEYCRAGEADRHRQRLRTMLQTGAGLVLNSQATARDLLEYAASEELRLPPHVVAPIGALRLPAPAPRPLLDGPYFVMLGTIEPRKNHLLLLHLWRQMIREGVDPLPTLVLVGQRGWECEQVIDLLDRCPGLPARVVERGDCDDRELSTWLHHARALLFPSFIEGYGMPLVEALAHGVPVIASDLPVFHEVAGDVPDYLDPLDGPAWRSRLLDYARPDSAARAAQLERLRTFSPPRWEQHFARVDGLLARIGAGEGGPTTG